MAFKLLAIISICAIWVWSIVDIARLLWNREKTLREVIGKIILLLFLGPLGYIVFKDDKFIPK